MTSKRLKLTIEEYYEDDYYVYSVSNNAITYIAKNLSGAGVARPLLRWLPLIEAKTATTAERYNNISKQFKKQL